jgi:Tfp pilus assembly protein PilX
MRRARKRRGATLVLVTMIGVIVGILGLSMIELGYDARILAVRDVEAISARCAVDAALAEASYRMQRKLTREAGAWTPISPGSGTLPGTNTQYSYNCEVVTPGSEYRIDATGTCGAASKTAHLTLGVGSYWEGICTEGAVNISNAVMFSAIPWGSGKGKICSNTTSPNSMSFTHGVIVHGDVFCGLGGDPDAVIVSDNPSITREASTERMDFPDVAVPTNLTDQGALEVTNATLHIPGGARYAYPTLTVRDHAHVYIDPDITHSLPQPTVICVSDTLTLESFSDIRVMHGASLELYIGQRLDCSTAIGIGNENSNATTLRILGLPTCTVMNLQNASNSHAVIYAPQAALTISNANVFYGAVVASSFTMANGGAFYFDTSLKIGAIGDPQAKFVVNHWWED